MPTVLVLYSEKKPITLEKLHYIKVIPGHLTRFPVGNQEGFLVGKKEKETPTNAMITMVTRVDKIIQGIKNFK